MGHCLAVNNVYFLVGGGEYFISLTYTRSLYQQEIKFVWNKILEEVVSCGDMGAGVLLIRIHKF